MPLDRSKNSHAFENMVEHIFLAELMRDLWHRREAVLEVAKAQVDSWGYDVVLTCGAKTRYLQLKTSVPCNVSLRLLTKTGACVVAVTLPDEASEAVAYRLWEAPADVGQLIEVLPRAKATKSSAAH